MASSGLVDEQDDDWSSTIRVPVGDYAVYLSSDAWKHKRMLKLRQADHRCQVCNGAGPLEVHHRTYERIGEEDEGDLIVLCERCHGLFHTNATLVKSESAEALLYRHGNSILAALCFIASAWAFTRMPLYSTFSDDPTTYLWRWTQLYACVTSGVLFVTPGVRVTVAVIAAVAYIAITGGAILSL